MQKRHSTWPNMLKERMCKHLIAKHTRREFIFWRKTDGRTDGRETPLLVWSSGSAQKVLLLWRDFLLWRRSQHGSFFMLDCIAKKGRESPTHSLDRYCTKAHLKAHANKVDSKMKKKPGRRVDAHNFFARWYFAHKQDWLLVLYHVGQWVLVLCTQVLRQQRQCTLVDCLWYFASQTCTCVYFTKCKAWWYFACWYFAHTICMQNPTWQYTTGKVPCRQSTNTVLCRQNTTGKVPTGHYPSGQTPSGKVPPGKYHLAMYHLEKYQLVQYQ